MLDVVAAAITGRMCLAGTGQGGRPAWVAEEMSAAWAALATHCGPLLADCSINEAQLWGPWANSPAPEATFPAGPAAKLNAFQRLLLMQVCPNCSHKHCIVGPKTTVPEIAVDTGCEHCCCLTAQTWCPTHLQTNKICTCHPCHLPHMHS